MDEISRLQARREDPVSAYDVKAGAVIPAIMIGGLSSDLPGQLIGQVAENVYDTATGRFILIPQGSKLIGTYDNAITTGQERVLVAWTRIIYPDASSLDLGKMPGADQGGYAGFNDRVNATSSKPSVTRSCCRSSALAFSSTNARTTPRRAA